MEGKYVKLQNYFFRKAVGAILVWRLKKALKRVGSEKPNA